MTVTKSIFRTRFVLFTFGTKREILLTTMSEQDGKQFEVEELEGSELGTKDYWDGRYDMEIRNYKSHGDVGEIWFDESSQDRIIQAIANKLEIAEEDRIIDIGSGNGMMLIELAQEGYKKLVGIDYSEQAVKLATNIATDHKFSEFIQYKVVDMVKEEGNDELESLGLFKVIHDKGTYDAISLNPDNTKEKRMAYLRNVAKIMEDDGYFIITSCNWTECELQASFEDTFKQHYIIPSPQFKFGGKVGSVVSSVVFQKKN